MFTRRSLIQKLVALIPVLSLGKSSLASQSWLNKPLLPDAFVDKSPLTLRRTNEFTTQEHIYDDVTGIPIGYETIHIGNIEFSKKTTMAEIRLNNFYNVIPDPDCYSQRVKIELIINEYEKTLKWKTVDRNLYILHRWFAAGV